MLAAVFLRQENRTNTDSLVYMSSCAMWLENTELLQQARSQTIINWDSVLDHWYVFTRQFSNQPSHFKPRYI